jgi:nucleoid-associated protein YgaU
MKLTLWLVLMSLFLVSCSGSKSAQKVGEETPQIELSDADEFIDTPVMDTMAEGEGMDPFAVDTPEIIDDGFIATNEPLVEESSLENYAPEVMTSSMGGDVRQYTVEKNETLMMIAFKLYGDYTKWKDLLAQNGGRLTSSRELKPGMTLSYVAPAEEFVWNPQGNPYLIRTGDTLGSISTEVYNTSNKWKLLWENNRPLIKDPNKIFAGFTIYYPESGREVASGI